MPERLSGLQKIVYINSFDAGCLSAFKDVDIKINVPVFTLDVGFPEQSSILVIMLENPCAT